MAKYESFFSVESGVLQYCGHPLPQELVRSAKHTLALHVLPEDQRDARGFLRSLLFCIASQRTEYERAVRFSQSLHNASLEQMMDVAYLRVRAQEADLIHSHKDYDALNAMPSPENFCLFPEMEDAASAKKLPVVENRFAPSIAYLRGHGVERIAKAYLEDPHKMREQLVHDVKFLAPKTTSFWYLCLGGKALFTMDVHCFRQIAGFVPIEERFTNGRLREKDKRIIPEQPSLQQYARIEQDIARALDHTALLKHEGTVDGALVTALFWMTGAMVRRGQHPSQYSVLPKELSFSSPYTNGA